MVTLDWIVIVVYFLIAMGIGLYFMKRAGQNISEYFVAGRSIPWWLAGVSMVATTFAADTPLAVTGIVASDGIAGNWIWWNFVLSGMFTVFFFARLWHRAGVMTDVEFIEIRYGGKPASILRGFRAIYLAFPINCVILGWVTLGMSKVLQVVTGVEPWQTILILYGMTAVYITLSGLWGVVVTDFLQFMVAMAGSIILMVAALGKTDGVSGLMEKLVETFGESHSYIQFSPINHPTLMISTVLVWIGMQWWVSWYPGAEPGGGGYIAQRMFSTRNEKEAVKATLFFNIAHYALRPWPWILVGLVSLVILPQVTEKAQQSGIVQEVDGNSVIVQYDNGELEDISIEELLDGWFSESKVTQGEKFEKGTTLVATDREKGYPYLMKTLLKPGLFGLLLVAFISAFMSTVSTHLNWGASYVVNDFYIRFVKPRNKFDSPESAEKHYVLVSRLSIILMAMAAILVSYFFESVKGGWEMILSLGAGTGLVYMLRWFWWRINAWSEISAMTAAFVGASISGSLGFSGFAEKMIFTTIFTTVIWLITTFLTDPEKTETLQQFYLRVQPGGPGWQLFTDIESESLLPAFLNVTLGAVVVWGFLFGIGKLIFGDISLGVIFVFTAGIAFYFVIRRMDVTMKGVE